MLKEDIERAYPVTKRLIEYALKIDKTRPIYAYYVTCVYSVYGEECVEMEEFTDHIQAYAFMDKMERKQRMQKLQFQKYLKWLFYNNRKLYDKIIEKMASNGR